MYKKLKKKKRIMNPDASDQLKRSLSRDLKENIDCFIQLFGKTGDLVIRQVQSLGSLHAAVLYLETIADPMLIDEFVVKELQIHLDRFASEGFVFPLNADKIDLFTNQLMTISTLEEGVKCLLSGNSLVLLDSHGEALAASTAGGQRRSVSEPTNESVVRGSRESFNESLQTNLGLIRKRLNTHQLRIEKMQIGKLSNTPVAILHMDGIAQEGIVEEVKGRLQEIEIDGILESLYIEEMIEDPRGYTPFPTIFNTERPDRIAAGLLEGRIAILIEGTPIALLVPATLGMFLFSNEDYYQRYDIASFLKLLRTFTFFLSIIMPGFYVAVLTYHQEMIPTPLLIALTGQREGVPFGIAIEVALMEVTFEILREAGIRLPKTIGSAVSIVGRLVLGQAAVEAGLVGAGTVIAVSITAIASFCTPSYNLAISARLIRFAFLGFSAFLGAFGLFFGLIIMMIHLNSLRSFSVPYLSPVSPYHRGDWRDLFVRFPWGRMMKRPEEIAGANRNRMPQKHPQQGGEER
ncbi:spore germination protein [Ammoniphilus sp. 3BR4]|uniref:spore germination protein n=1 Tax=Ammoniphilus sp. 3BR4 TaxID=3158265 RepID=UPI0034654B48